MLGGGFYHPLPRVSGVQPRAGPWTAEEKMALGSLAMPQATVVFRRTAP